MRAAHRRIDPGLIDQLIEAPHRFEFFQAVRLLERYFRLHRPGRSGTDEGVCERIRFRNTLSLAFAPSQIEAIEADYDAEQAGTAGAGPHGVRLTPTFMGMLGVHGVLPAHYTERITERERFHRDHAARAFLDLFSNRSVGQFYQAWKKYRLPLQYETDRHNHFLPVLLALGGLGFPALRDRLRTAPGSIDDESIGYFAGVLQQRPLSAAALQNVLSGHFGAPIRVEQFVGKWYLLPPGQRACLGGTNALLGRTALVGERVWQRDLRVRIHVGPLARAHYLAFLPGGESCAALEKLLTLASGSRFEYEVRPILRAADVQAACLDAKTGVRLGFDAFLCTRESTRDRSDTAFEVHSIH
jgi:type VI secretion system protein ImpH